MINIIDFSTGTLVPLIDSQRFPVGRVLTYEDRANPRRKYVVTSATPEPYGQPVFGESGQRTHCMPSCIDRGGWSDTGVTLSPEEIAAFIAAATERQAREAIERKQAAEKAATDRAQRSAAAIQAHPYLVPLAQGEYASAKAGAANLRRHLKHAFPGIKFSVRSDTFSGGDSIDIKWAMGPTVKEVEAISNRYQEGHFNGMEDIYEHDYENVWPALFGGAKYVNACREDGEAYNTIAGHLCDLFSVERPANNAFWTLRGEDDDRVCGTTRGLLSATSFPAGAVITGVRHLPEGQRRDDIGYVRSGFACFYEVTFTSPTSTPATPAPASAASSDPSETSAQSDTTTAPAPAPSRSSKLITPAQMAIVKPEWDAMKEFLGLPPDDAPTTADAAAVRIIENTDKNGVEIHFPSKPPAFLLDSLKSLGWRWSRHAGCWYHRTSAEALAFAQNIAATWTPAVLQS